MERKGKNKENRNPGRNMTITDAFKVKKCLFDSTKPSESPVKPSSPMVSCSPNMLVANDDSPFALFQCRKPSSFASPMVSCSPNTLANDDSPFALFTCRKRSSFPSPNAKNHATPLKRSCSLRLRSKEDDVPMESPLSEVKLAVQKAMTEDNLIGNFSKACLLPTISGRHQDMKAISPETVANLLTGELNLSYKIFDCRYPYEFQGGHIKSAVNVFNKGEAEKDFFKPTVMETKLERSCILIFYCEFSSERAPGMIRFLRNKDRDLNRDCYPFLYYPELYLIEGGYKAFYSTFKELCEPQEYTTMLDKDCAKELGYYKSLCKSHSWKSKRGKRAKTVLVFDS